MRVGLRIAAIGNQRARGGLLQRDAAGIERDGASERGNGLLPLPLLRFGAGDALFDEAVVGINLGGAQKRRKISFVGAQSEMKLVEATPQEQKHSNGNSERRSRENVNDARASRARRTRGHIGYRR